MIPNFIVNQVRVLIPVTMLFAGVFIQDFLQYIANQANEQNLNNEIRLFDVEALARFDGETEKELYISVLGSIFDVSAGPQHYAKGSPYNYFVGKDGSRALVTGDFKDESENKDHVLDLPCTDFLSLLKWKETLEKKYKVIGTLTGRYYESDGKSTAYMLQFKERINKCLEEKDLDRKQDLKYPPCNIAWSEHEGTKVWCTKTSGGANRDWVGVPRQLFTPGDQRPRCVCIDTTKDQDSSIVFKEYENCANTSVVCFVDSG